MPQARGTHFVVTKTDEAIQSSADHISRSCSLDKAQTVLHPPVALYPYAVFRTPAHRAAPREVQHEYAFPGTGLMPYAGDEDLREHVPDGQKRRELPPSIKLMLISPLTYALLPGFETRIDLKFRNREGNIQKDVSRNESQPRHVGSDEGRIRACYNAGIRDENTVPVG